MYIFKFADIGEGIHEGKVSDILVKVGDSVKDGTDLFSVETDKITTEVSSPVNGVIKKILFNVGDTIHVGQPLFEIDDSSGQSSPSSQSIESPQPSPSLEKEDEKLEDQGGASVVGQVKVSNDILPLFGSNKNAVNSIKSSSEQSYVNNNVLASPVARFIAIENNIDLKTVKGTGPNERITKQDVENLIGSSPKTENLSQNLVKSSTSSSSLVTSKPEPVMAIAEQANDKKLEMTSIRKAIANAMKRSWSNAAYTNLSLEIDVTEVWDQRNKIKDFIFETENVKLNLLPFIVKSIAKTLKEFPMFNAVCDESTNSLILRGDINIGIAVDTKDGLIVPNIKNADRLSILDIAKAISEIASKARNKKISMQDITNGTFSVTNYGSLGVNFGVPVINYPEVAIAGLGTISSKITKNGPQLVERKVMILTIAADHRWVDGADIARFGSQVKQYLENIALLFI